MKAINNGARLLHIRGKTLLPGQSIDLSADDLARRGIRLVLESGRLAMSSEDLAEAIKSLKAKLGPRADT